MQINTQAIEVEGPHGQHPMEPRKKYIVVRGAYGKAIKTGDHIHLTDDGILHCRENPDWASFFVHEEKEYVERSLRGMVVKEEPPPSDTGIIGHIRSTWQSIQSYMSYVVGDKQMSGTKVVASKPVFITNIGELRQFIEPFDSECSVVTPTYIGIVAFSYIMNDGEGQIKVEIISGDQNG